MHIVQMGGLARPEIAAALTSRGEFTFGTADTAADLKSEVARIQGLITMSPLYTQEVVDLLRQAPGLRWIQFLSAGYENAEQFGLPEGATLTNAGDLWSPSVAEHTMALLLALYRNIPEMLNDQRGEIWRRAFFPKMRSLHGHTMLIVGLGSIGREVAKRARAFGMHLIGVNRSGAPHHVTDEMTSFAHLDQVLPNADVVVIAVPSNDDTRGLFNSDRLSLCKKGAVLINVARGDIVDSSAMESALRSGHLGGAGLDVTDPEPLPTGHSLWSAPNAIISPHVAGAFNADFKTRMAALVLQNAQAISAGQKPVTAVSLST